MLQLSVLILTAYVEVHFCISIQQRLKVATLMV